MTEQPSKNTAVPEAPVTLISRPKAFDRNKAAREYEKEHPEFAELRMKAMRARHAGTHLKIFQTEPSQFFVNGMNAILATRMQGLPIVNPKLAVRSALNAPNAMSNAPNMTTMASTRGPNPSSAPI